MAGAADLIEMLGEDATPEQFDAAAAQLLAEHGDAATVAALTAAARALRTTLNERARRERELLALFETAGDLSSLRDMDTVLAAIVGRARDLLATDVAYLTLFDHANGDTYMRVTAGIRSDEFKAVRLPLGAGLGGRVAESLRPQWSPSYLTDPQFSHQRPIDSAVAAEELVAIAGVPITLDQQAIGVLFAASRHSRGWSPDDVALLQSLADHAAIALDNARLFAESQQALDDLRAANEVIGRQNDALERAAALHGTMSAIVLERGGLDDIAKAASDTLAGPIVVSDPNGRVLAAAGDRASSNAIVSDDGELLAEAVLSASQRAAASAHAVAVGDSRGPAWVTALRAGRDALGYLVLARQRPLDDADRRMLERTAQVTALVLVGEQAVLEAEVRARGDLLGEVLNPLSSDEVALARRCALHGVDLAEQHVVICALVDDVDRAALPNAAARIAAEGSGLAGVRDGVVVVIRRSSDAPAAAESVHRGLRAHAIGAVTIGAGGPAAGRAALIEAHGDAMRSLAVLTALGREGEWATPGRLGIYAMLLGTAGREQLETFVQSTIGAVVDYDAERGTSLVATLGALLAERFHLARTSERLVVHVNTLRQRIDRLDQLLPAGWRHDDEALQVQLALRLRRVLDASPVAPA